MISKIKAGLGGATKHVANGRAPKTHDAVSVAALIDVKGLIDRHGRETLQQALDVLEKLAS